MSKNLSVIKKVGKNDLLKNVKKCEKKLKIKIFEEFTQTAVGFHIFTTHTFPYITPPKQN